ncbi:MAG: hypothetical protein R3E86_16500 [Pseudomonadales bacterium]
MSPIRHLTMAAVVLTTISLKTIALAAGDADDFYEIKDGSRELLALLESLPYATEGSGPVMYTFQYSECPYSQGMYRDYPATATGLELRRLMVPVSERSAREAAALGTSRNIADYHAFMSGSRVAPPVRSDPHGVEIHNRILEAVATFESILARNAWPARGLVYPQFVWLEEGRVFTSAGYERADYAKAVARAQRGGGLAAVWRAAAAAPHPATAGTAGTAEATPADRRSSAVNIVGIELGMTHEQLLAAVRAHDPKLRLMEHTSDIIVRDSYRRPFKVDDYVAEIQATWDQRVRGYQAGDPQQLISVVFTGPPSEHRVESILREVRYVDTQSYPGFEALVQALTTKYGAADLSERRSQTTQMVWQLDGKSLSERHLRMLGGSALNSNNSHSTRYHLFPVIDDSLPPNVLSISGDGMIIRHGNAQYVEGGRFLAIQIVQQGSGVNFMRAVLQDSMMKIGRARGATAQMAQAALARHEREVRAATQQRRSPDI